MKYKNLVFDFDGVLAESVDVKTRAYALLFEGEGEEVVQEVVDFHLKNGGVSRFEKFKFYHKEYFGIELTNQQLQELANKFSELVVQKVIAAPYVPGALEFIQNNY